MDPLVTLLAVVGSALIGLWFTRHIWRALATGAVNVHNVALRRRKQPVYFWSAFIIQALWGALFYANAWRMAHRLFLE